MAKQRSTRDSQMRLLIAQEAARLMAGDGRLDYYGAKHKAAEHLGARDTRNLPRNIEIEEALQEYQRIFLHDSHPQHLRHLREAAIEAMQLLAEFDPHLAGPVLQGTAGPHSEIQLHIYASSVETVTFFLMDHDIPYRLHETALRFNGEEQNYPSLSFIAGEDTIDIVIFPDRKLKQAPKSPIDGKAMKRARLDEVRALLNETVEV
ncbi:MAG: hypothetical protein HUJ29_12470 [Gammaproteobacteria bacterium]|nr:hypothetical protein [Gammaproteobacteria bacterium]